MSVNKVILVGRLGNNPEVRFTPAGSAVANFNIATNENWTDKNGQKQERTEWHRIVVWGKVAQLCGEYLTKGRQVYIEGRLQTRQWQDKEGQTKYTTEVIANTVQFLGTSGRNQDASSDAVSAAEGTAQGLASVTPLQAGGVGAPPLPMEQSSFTEEDIPF